MNTSHLASKANLGGALQPRLSALRILAANHLSSLPVHSGIWMRRLILIGFHLLSVTQVIAAPAVALAWDPNPETDIRGYVLSYGTSPGLYPNVIDVGPSTEALVANLAEDTTYYFVVSAVNAAGIQSPSSTELAYFVETEIPSPNGWALKYADSEDLQGYGAARAFDGNPTTFWHTTWRSDPAPPPHEIQIDLGADQAMSGFRYLPRQDQWLSGTVGQFEFFVSADGVNWGSPVAAGTFPCTHDLKEVRFPATRGRYIRFRGLTDGNGGPYMCVAELGLIQDSAPPVTNQAPSCPAIARSLLEDTTLPLTLSGTDADGDALSYSVVTAPSNGVLSGNPPNLTYTPFANRTGADSFTFVANDGTVSSAPATVSIMITAANDAPTAHSATVTLVEDSPLPVVLTASDPDGDPLSFIVFRGPAKGTLSGTAPNLIYSPEANFSGSDEFTYRVTDGTADSAPATVSISVTPANDPPLAISLFLTTKEDSALPITLRGTDPDQDNLSFSVVTHPTHGTLAGTAPNLTYIPASNFTGTDQFSFDAYDGTVRSGSATVSIEVSALNDPPVALAQSVSTASDQALPLTLAGSDSEGNPLTFTLLGGPSNGTLAGIAPNLIYQPAAGFIGTDEFAFQVSDGTTFSAPAKVSVTVAKVSLLPDANRIPRSNWTLKFVDSEQTPDSPGIFAFDADLGKFWQTARSSGSALPHEIQINLGSTQSISGFQYLPRQDGSAEGNIGDYEFYVSLDGENWGSPAATGRFPNSSAEMEVGFPARSGKFVRLKALTEINGGTTTCVADLNVLKGIVFNQLPLAHAQSLVMKTDSSLSVVLGGSDPEGSALTYSMESGPLHGAVSGTPPNLIYLPNPGFLGNDQFTFRSNDGVNFSAPATVSISVAAVTEVPGNAAPMFTAEQYELITDEDVPVEGQLFATDADVGDLLTFQKISGPTWLTISAEGQLVGTPRNADVGTSAFSIEVRDPSNATGTATLTVTVTNTNDAPIFRISPLVGAAGTEKVPYSGIKLADSAFDPDAGGTLIFSKASGPVWLTVSSSGSLSGTPPSGSAGTNQFTIRATDSTGAFSEESLQIKIYSNTLPLPWSLDRVGRDNIAGGANFSSGVFSIGGSGGMASTEDSGSLGWQTLSGDGAIVARVTKLTDTGTGTRVGVMIRDSLAPSSRQIFMGVDGAGKYHWTRRLTTGGSTAKTTVRAARTGSKIWLRMVRTLNVVVVSQSTDGINWTKIGKCTVVLPKNCYIGLWVGSGEDQILNSSQFGNVVVTP